MDVIRTIETKENRMMREQEAFQYCAMGRTRFRQWAQEIGARRTFGRSVRYDRQVIDAELDRMAAEEIKGSGLHSQKSRERNAQGED